MLLYILAFAVGLICAFQYKAKPTADAKRLSQERMLKTGAIVLMANLDHDEALPAA
jgi:hypothetical protein